MRIQQTSDYQSLFSVNETATKEPLKSMAAQNQLAGMPGVEVEISQEGLHAWREKVNEWNPYCDVGEKMGIENTNEVMMEHFRELQEISLSALESGKSERI